MLNLASITAEPIVIIKQINAKGESEDFVPETHATKIWEDLTTLNGG